MSPEARWIAWLRTAPDARRALRQFCPHYFYFSHRQVVAFSGLFRLVDPLDRKSLAMLARVLYEELGEGEAERVHSRLFERFAGAVGLAPDALLTDPAQVLPGVRAYVDELERAFTVGPQAEALATYVFLESSAVDTYGPLVEALLDLGFDAEEVEFFQLHAGLEPEHAEAAEEMLRSYGLDGADPVVAAQTGRLADLWAGFWTEIDAACRAGVAA